MVLACGLREGPGAVPGLGRHGERTMVGAFPCSARYCLLCSEADGKREAD